MVATQKNSDLSLLVAKNNSDLDVVAQNSSDLPVVVAHNTRDLAVVVAESTSDLPVVVGENTSDLAVLAAKAGERGGQGGQNTWGPDWFGGPEILIKHLVIVLLLRGLGARNA